jgi:hypothetical protein
MAGSRAIVFQALQKAESGTPEVILVVLSVCGAHVDAVVEWAKTRAVSEGVLVEIEGMDDLLGMAEINRQAHRRGDPLVSNAAGGVALLPA